MKNIILIGMPAVGKSTIGNMLSKFLGMNYVDTDKMILDSCMMPLSEIIEKHGRENFIKIENAVLCNCNVTNSVISTGGSAVYSENGMKHLKENGIVIYIDISFDEIKKRLGRMKSRGVVIQNGQTLEDLYNERVVLYKKYADITVSEENLSIDQTTKECIKELKLKKYIR